MTIEEHITEFAGKRVVDWEPGDPLPDPQDGIPRVSVQWDETEEGKRWTDKLSALLADPASRELTGIVVGPWGEVATGEATAEVVVEALVAARDQLPNLRAIFLGDITFEESEISWIEQTDVSPLLTAYPELEHLTVRGGNNLSLGPLQHNHLRGLVVQTGGLPREVVHQVNKAQLPELEHLELWLGDSGYGADTTVEDLEPILSGRLFPRLKYLGLRDSEIADEVATAVAAAPILERIEVLDLSMGALTDDGARALLNSPALPGPREPDVHPMFLPALPEQPPAQPIQTRLRKLDIHYHYCSEEMVEKLKKLPIEVDASDRQEPGEYDGEVYRSVAVAE